MKLFRPALAAAALAAGILTHAAETRILKRRATQKHCGGQGQNQFPPCVPPVEAAPEPEPLDGRIIPQDQHQPFPVAAHVEAPSVAIRTEYDRCVFDELTNRPPSQQHGFAQNCYVDCLQGRASFAPRMCYRLCVNALTLKYPTIDGGGACAALCPAAAHSLWMNADFCPPLPEVSPGPISRRVAEQEAHEALYGPAPAPPPSPAGAPGPPGVPYPAHREGVWSSREFPEDEFTFSRRWPGEQNDTVTTDGRLMDNAT